jgi:hypothetical protein
MYLHVCFYTFACTYTYTHAIRQLRVSNDASMNSRSSIGMFLLVGKVLTLLICLRFCSTHLHPILCCPRSCFMSTILPTLRGCLGGLYFSRLQVSPCFKRLLSPPMPWNGKLGCAVLLSVAGAPVWVLRARHVWTSRSMSRNPDTFSLTLV